MTARRTYVYRRGPEASWTIRPSDGAELLTDVDDETTPRAYLKVLMDNASGLTRYHPVTVDLEDLEDLGRSLAQVVHNLTTLVGAGACVVVGAGSEATWFFDESAGAQPPEGAGRPAEASQLLTMLDDVRRSGAARRARRGVAGARARGSRLGAPRLLTDEQVAWAAEQRELGEPYVALGYKLGVSAQTVARALRARTGHDRGVPHPGTEAPTDDATASAQPHADTRPDEPGRSLL